MDGMGRRMKTVFIVYTIAGLSLIGIPPMIGFVSKWYIGNAAVAQGTVYSYIGLAALILSALLTAAYILEVVVRAWLPGEQATAKVAVKLQDNSGEQAAETVSTENTEIQSAQATENASDVQPEGDEIRPVGWRMRLPLVLLATIVVAMGIWSGPVLRFLADVAAGLR
jgi:multicomponent Na+:H+ antiporter subunit D